jgi:hypothetical protein
MMSPMAFLGVAVCAAALICLLLIKQAQKRQGHRRWSDGSGSDGGSYLGDAGTSHSHSHSPGSGGDHSGSGDSGSSGDSGGGSDGGGGGDGGGGD